MGAGRVERSRKVFGDAAAHLPVGGRLRQGFGLVAVIGLRAACGWWDEARGEVGELGEVARRKGAAAVADAKGGPSAEVLQCRSKKAAAMAADMRAKERE